MTKREFLENVIAMVESDEIKAFAQSEITKMDERNAKRKDRPSKKSVENEPIKKAIVEFVGEESRLASEIAKGVEISTQKASALCRQLVTDGVLAVTEVKVKGKGKQKSYAVA